jgi:hypothetical protein
MYMICHQHKKQSLKTLLTIGIDKTCTTKMRYKCEALNTSFCYKQMEIHPYKL